MAMPQLEETSVRRACADDADALIALIREGDAHHQPFDTLAINQGESVEADRGGIVQQMDDPRRYILVAVSGGMVVGLARCWIEDRPRSRLFAPLRMVIVTELVISRTHRRMGIGAELMDAVRAHSEEIGADRILLSYYDANDGAGRFYEKLGYAPLMSTVVLDL